MEQVTTLQLLHEAEIAIVLSVGGWMILFPVRTLYSKVKEIVDNYKESMKEMKEELITQRTNCLTTLQTQGEEQIKVLNKVSSTLEAMHLAQVEMTGYMKGSNRQG